MSFYIIFSGFFGTAMGSAVTFAMIRHREWLVAKSRLGGILFQISYELEYSGRTVEDIMRPHFIPLWVGGRDAASLALPWKSKIIKDKTDLICGSIKGIMQDRSVDAPVHSLPSKKKAKEHADEFLNLLGYT